MYTAKESFTSSKGVVYFRGEQISDFKYFFLPRRDKEKFIKAGASNSFVNKVRNTPSAVSSKYLPTHYGYGPEPGYTSETVPISHRVHDADHTPHDFSGFGGGSGGGAGASGSWDSGSDSGSSSYDSGSSDSGGGDSGGGDGGGGGD